MSALPDPAARTAWHRRAASALALALLCGCQVLQPLSAPDRTYFSLADERSIAPVAAQAPATALTLIVNPPHAAAGYDSPRMVYMRQANQPEYFAEHEWIDTPARMLAPLLVASIERSGGFRAVILGPSSVAGDLRLDVEILRLRQEFLATPSRVHFALRAYVIDDATRRVLASREFEASAPAPSEDAYGGVQAANQAVQSVLDELAALCAQTASAAPPRAGTAPR
jgi:cholesterol transport system auxiliary component